MANKLQEVFFDVSGKTQAFIEKCHNEQKVYKGCSTCANIKHVRDYPNFVTAEENECTVGLECDTVLFEVKNCPKWKEKEIINDKLTPKRMIGVEEGYEDRAEICYYCPTCNTDLSLYNVDKINYCFNCGQRVYVD